MTDPTSNPGCSTPGCPGDPRYPTPGRSHLANCTHPRPAPPVAHQDTELDWRLPRAHCGNEYAHGSHDWDNTNVADAKPVWFWCLGTYVPPAVPEADEAAAFNPDAPQGFDGEGGGYRKQADR